MEGRGFLEQGENYKYPEVERNQVSPEDQQGASMTRTEGTSGQKLFVSIIAVEQHTELRPSVEGLDGLQLGK